MTDTITEVYRPQVGDHVEVQYADTWHRGRVTISDCPCHITIRQHDTGIERRYPIEQDGSSVRPGTAPWVPEVGETVWQTYLFPASAATVLEVRDYGEQVYLEDSANGWANRWVSSRFVHKVEPEPNYGLPYMGQWSVIESNILPDGMPGPLGDRIIGESVSVLSVDGDAVIVSYYGALHRCCVIPYTSLDVLATERVSHGETPQPGTFPVGRIVTFPFGEGTLTGVVRDEPAEGVTDGRVPVLVEERGTMWPLPSDCTLLDPVEWARGLSDDDPDHEEAGQILARIEGLTTQADTVRTEHREFLDRVQEMGSRYANDQGWCEVADGGLEELGLRRDRNEAIGWSHVVRVSLLTTDPTTLLRDHLRRQFDVPDDFSISLDDNLTEEAEAWVDIHVSGTIVSQGCVCDEVTDEDIRERLPVWVEEAGLTWEIEEENCDND